MKPRREITLGEMQDECKARSGVCVSVGVDIEEMKPKYHDCKFKSVCPFQMQSRKAVGWDLSDPPRFNEAQMALMRGLWEAGARKMIYHPDIDNRWIKFEREDRTMIACVEMKALGYEAISGAYEHNLLAELLGKDGADGT